MIIETLLTDALFAGIPPTPRCRSALFTTSSFLASVVCAPGNESDLPVWCVYDERIGEELFPLHIHLLKHGIGHRLGQNDDQR